MNEPADFPKLKIRGMEIPIKFRTSDIIRLKTESGLDLFNLPTKPVNGDAWDMVAKLLSHGIRETIDIPPMTLADELDFVYDRATFRLVDAAVTEALKKAWAQSRAKESNQPAV